MVKKTPFTTDKGQTVTTDPVSNVNIKSETIPNDVLLSKTLVYFPGSIDKNTKITNFHPFQF